MRIGASGSNDSASAPTAKRWSPEEPSGGDGEGRRSSGDTVGAEAVGIAEESTNYAGFMSAMFPEVWAGVWSAFQREVECQVAASPRS
jgi:hypothetical protein